jgi:hypothetical protein
MGGVLAEYRPLAIRRLSECGQRADQRVTDRDLDDSLVRLTVSPSLISGNRRHDTDLVFFEIQRQSEGAAANSGSSPAMTFRARRLSDVAYLDDSSDLGNRDRCINFSIAAGYCC